MKTYKYRGYEFYATNVLHASTSKYLYEIPDLKKCGQRPFLTTIRQCREYIDQEIDMMELRNLK